MAHNKFGDYIAASHAALTAEGDNRVLMVKVCKDMMTNVLKKGFKLPQMYCSAHHYGKLSDITDIVSLLDLLKFRETILFKKLVADTKNLGKAGVSGYNILMRETSDAMQDLAQAYGERQTLEYCMLVLSTKIHNTANKDIMSKVFRLFAADCINRDLSFYMMHGVVSQAAAGNLTPTRHTLIKNVAAKASDILDCMSIPKHALYVPIA